MQSTAIVIVALVMLVSSLPHSFASFFGGTEHVHVRIHVPIIHHETERHKEVHYHHHDKPSSHHHAHGGHSSDGGSSSGSYHASALHLDAGHSGGGGLYSAGHSGGYGGGHTGSHTGGGYTYAAPAHHQNVVPVGHPVTLTGYVIGDHDHHHQQHGHHASGLTTVTGVVIGEEQLHQGHSHHGDAGHGLSAGYDLPQHHHHADIGGVGGGGDHGHGHGHEFDAHVVDHGIDFSLVQNAFKSAQEHTDGFAPSTGAHFGGYEDHHQHHHHQEGGHQQYGAPPVAAALTASFASHHQHSAPHTVYGAPASPTSFGHGPATGHDAGHHQQLHISTDYANLQTGGNDAGHHGHEQHPSHGYAVTDTYADTYAAGYDTHGPSQDSYISALGHSGASAHQAVDGDSAGQHEQHHADHHHEDSYSGPDSYSAAPSGTQTSGAQHFEHEAHDELQQQQGYDYAVPSGGGALHH